MLRFIPLFLLLICICHVLSAKEIAVGPQASAFLDTEASTNVSFNVRRNDVKAFDVRIELESSVSNCVQVAFGRDADEDGDLAPEETDFVLGWRGGRYFIEDVDGEDRRFAEASEQTSNSRFLRMAVTTDANFVPKAASFSSETGPCFTDVGVPDYLFRTNWNLAKVTRRGVVPAAEWCRIVSDYRKFVIRFR